MEINRVYKIKLKEIVGGEILKISRIEKNLKFIKCIIYYKQI